MFSGLAEAAEELRRKELLEELILTNHDVAFLKACGIKGPRENEKTLGRQILERFWEEDR